MAQAGKLIRSEYSEIMQKSYIDYAMSVIVARALPDVRDGLKPVQRRILYDMYELGIRFDRPYRKCARIVGDTMGKYHPHGDSSIYEALVVLAQDFKRELPLVDGHGNFGSIEGDGAAAMRYTEARLAKIAQEVYLADLDKDIVDFGPNFDETEKEPLVLPVRIPNVLVNGAEGIAVGMATSIPSHNLSEVIDGCIAYMKDPDINTAEMMQYIKGPDFPTGGIVANQDELLEIYSTGQGKIKLRGKVNVEKLKGGKEAVVVTEIPATMVGANIGKFLNDVSALSENRQTTDIVDISNQSSKDGIRIVIELKKGADTEKFINLLYKKTKLSDTLGVNMLVVADGRPQTLGIVPLIRHHVDFQFEIANRKYTTLLAKAEHDREIQEGLMKAYDVIDLIIEVIRGSKKIEDAKLCLTTGDTKAIKFKDKSSEILAKGFNFTENQADAILRMRLYRLIGLEIEALRKEHDKTQKDIELFERLLSKKSEMAKAIIKDLTAIKEEFGIERKTVIDNVAEAEIEAEPVVEMDVAVLMDRFGYAKCIDIPTFERNKEAAISESTRIIFTSTADKLCIFTDVGAMHTLRVRDISLSKFRDKGTPIDNLSNYDGSKERMLFIDSLKNIQDKQLLFVSGTSMLKRVTGDQFDVTRKTIAATSLTDGDSLVFVGILEDEPSIVLQTQGNYFLRFATDAIPEKKKTAIGVRGMKLTGEDRVKEAFLLAEGAEIVAMADSKKVKLHELKPAGRDTKGSKK